MLSPSMIRILRWLNDHAVALESAWDVPRSLSLEGIADGIGVVRSALFQPMNALEDDGLIVTRQAHVIGAGRRKRKVVHITQNGRNLMHEYSEEIPERSLRTSSNLKGQIPEYTLLHGRDSECRLLLDAIAEGLPIHLRGMPGIGKSALARSMIQPLAEQGMMVHWTQLDAYCDVAEAMQRMEIGAPQILDVEGYASFLQGKGVVLVFDDVHTISQRHEPSFSLLFQKLQENAIPFVLIGRDRDTFSIQATHIELGPLELSDAIELLDPDLGDKRASIVETLGGHPLAILLYNDSTPLPETDQDVRAYVEQVVLSDANSEVHDAMSPFLVLPFPVGTERMPNPDHVPLLDEHALLRWGAHNATMEMQHLIRNVCRSALDASRIDALHAAAIVHWQQQEDALASILEIHHRIQRGESGIADHLSVRTIELMNAYSGAFATLLDEALENESGDMDLIGLAAQHALNRAEVEIAKGYLENINPDELVHIRLQIAQFEGKKDSMERIESMLDGLEHQDEKLRIQLSVLSRCIDDTSSRSDEENERIDRLLEQVHLPDDENQRHVILTTLVVMKHALALERRDFTTAGFLLDQLRDIAPSSDPLIQFLETKTELKSHPTESPTADLVLNNAEHIASKLGQPLYKASIRLLICERLLEKQVHKARQIHDQIDARSLESMKTSAARRLLAKWWEVKSLFNDHEQVYALREAIVRYRSVGCPNRARVLSKRLHNM